MFFREKCAKPGTELPESSFRKGDTAWKREGVPLRWIQYVCLVDGKLELMEGHVRTKSARLSRFSTQGWHSA